MDNSGNTPGFMVTRNGIVLYDWWIPSRADHIGRSRCSDPTSAGSTSGVTSLRLPGRFGG